MRVALVAPGGEPAATPTPEDAGTPDGRFRQLWPHRHGTDAMFCALLSVGGH